MPQGFAIPIRLFSLVGRAPAHSGRSWVRIPQEAGSDVNQCACCARICVVTRGHSATVAPFTSHQKVGSSNLCALACSLESNVGVLWCAIGGCILRLVAHSVQRLVLSVFCAMDGVWFVKCGVLYVWSTAHSVTLIGSVMCASSCVPSMCAAARKHTVLRSILLYDP